MLPLPYKTKQTSSSPAKGRGREAKARLEWKPWASECLPQMERFGPLQWRIKVWAPVSPYPGRGQGVVSGEASGHLSIWLHGAGTEAKRGLSVSFGSVLPIVLSRLGWGLEVG